MFKYTLFDAMTMCFRMYVLGRCGEPLEPFFPWTIGSLDDSPSGQYG
jgi:hypothetical protein